MSVFTQEFEIQLKSDLGMQRQQDKLHVKEKWKLVCVCVGPVYMA